MKKDDNKLSFFSNRFVLLITPYLLFISLYMSYFLRIEKYNYTTIMPLEALYEFYLLIFVLLIGYNLVLSLITKNKLLSWVATMLISIFIYQFYNIYQLLIVLFILGIIVFLLRKKILVKDNLIIKMANLFVSFYFLIFLIPTIYESINYLVHMNRTNADYTVVVDESKKIKPNIYYIHCDAMMSMEAMSKYFNYDDSYLNDFLTSNDYIVGRDASLIAGHRTQFALVALFNPYYYDNKEKEFLDDVEDTINNGKNHSKSYIPYSELLDKRLNSELLSGLSSAGYKTYGIGIYNQFTSIDTDSYYYFNYYKAAVNHHGKELTLKMIDSNTSKSSLRRYINLHTLADVYFNPKVFSKFDYMNFLKDTKNVDTSNLDLSKYKYLDSTKNEKVKMIIAGLRDIYNSEDSSRFVFVDYDLNHLNIAYDKNGEEEYGQREFVDAYRENYMYLSYLLVDIVRYINDNDPNSVIILQSDHGNNVTVCETLMKDLDIEKSDCANIRNSTFSAVYVPEEYKLGNEEYLNNPLNISRYIINNYVGDNYKYIQ